MEVWKSIFLSKWLISRFHVNLPGSMSDSCVQTLGVSNMDRCCRASSQSRVFQMDERMGGTAKTPSGFDRTKKGHL